MSKRVLLDSNNCSLDGIYLIEASAGTGKTYNIQNLAVRLILEKNLSIEEILIVTFTRAATAELTDRIRGIIQSCFDFLDQLLQQKTVPEEKKFSREHDLLGNVIPDFSDKDKLRHYRTKLQQALLDFDNNAISTIHGFCQRMLRKNAFESGILFQTELTGSEQIKDQILSLIRNQWRKICYAPENKKYIGLYRGLLPFDQAFEPEAGGDRDEYRLQTEGFRGRAKMHYTAGYVAPGLQEFVSLIEKPEMAFDREEDCSPAELAEKIFSCLSILQRNIPEISVPNKNPKEDPIPAKDFSDCPFEYGFGWNMFETMVCKADFETLSGQGSAEVRTFCETIQEITQYMFRFRAGLLNLIRKNTAEQLESLKRRDNFQTYDDLQKRMIAALNVPNSQLAETLRKQFKAAIIDEFQDTDQGQYEIFSKVFAPCLKSGQPVEGSLFFVGDPKQAIYAFRGGDIFTYKSAVSDVGENRILSLNRNFRSADILVSAVNEIFSSHQFPFADPTIRFEEVESSGKKTLKFNGEPDQTPFHYLAGGKNKKTIYAVCAEKICQLLTSDVQIPSPDSKDESKYIPLKPSDIAILCRKMTDQALLLEQLQLKGIPYVTTAEINIYDTQEARDLEKLLLAVQLPTDIKAVTWLMQTSLVHEMDCRSLCTDSDPESGSAVVKIQKALAELKNVFEQSGFAEMFRMFMEIFKIHKRYPGLRLGAQRYSNLIQLRDILAAEEKKGHKSPVMLTLWLQKQLSPETRTELDAHIILPTDAPAVRVMTIHNSKGLQFPIVFLPDLAGAEVTEEKSMKYHDAERNNGIYHRLGSGKQMALALAESLQEELRITYVAFTRASRASYLLIPEKNNSFNAVHWLYTAKMVAPDTLPGELRAVYSGTKRKSLREAIGEDKIETVKESATVYQAPEGRELSLLSWGNCEIPEPAPRISYSSAHKYFHRNEKRSLSEEETSGELNVSRIRSPEEKSDPVFTLPRGDLFGTACHAILEKWDFRSPEKLEDLITRNLSVVNIREKAGIAVQMFRKTVSAPIPQEDGTPFTLQELSFYDRCSEMDFDFNLNRNFNPGEIGAILNRHYRERLEKENLDLLYAIRNQVGETTAYTGSADLIFRYNGKFYIADWKTDILEETLESFNPEFLFGVMWQKFYLYQSLLYSAALIRFLSLRLKKSPEKVYEEDFGGVRYLFLRGIDPAVPGRGIYADKPDFELICKIAEVE